MSRSAAERGLAETPPVEMLDTAAIRRLAAETGRSQGPVLRDLCRCVLRQALIFATVIQML